MVKEVFAWLISNGETALGVDVVKGFPTWGRSSLLPPVGALELSGFGPGFPARIGQKQARHTCSFRFWIFARHEPELCEMLDSLAAWLGGAASFTAGGRRVDLVMGEGVRHESTSGAQQEQYGFWVPVSTTWPA